MRRTARVLVVGAVLLMLGTGVALAATINCVGGLCQGTNRQDTLFGTSASTR